MRREREERERRRKRMVWRHVRGTTKEERIRRLTEWMEEVMERKIRTKGIEERMGEGRIVMIIEMEEEEDKREILKKRKMFWKRYGIGADEDMSMEER